MTDRDLVPRDGGNMPTTSPGGKNYLLAIAINEYQYCSKLSNAVLDVEAFIEILKTRYYFDHENIIFFKNAEATKRHIERAFNKLIDLINPEDNLVIYFSGHGRYNDRRGGFWVPVEASNGDDDWPDYLSNSLIKDYLGKIHSFHTFLIADSCFSGSLFIDKGKEKLTGDRRDTEPSRWGLTSGKKEIVSDGEPGQHSPFAIALLDVLRKTEQPIGVMRICDLVLEKVVANALQTPMGSPLQVVGHQGGQMVLYLRKDEERIWTITKSTNTIKAYISYLDQFPNGKYCDIALDKLEVLEEKIEWDKVPKNKLSALLRYLRNNPVSPFLVEALGLIKKLNDAEVNRFIEDSKFISTNYEKVLLEPKFIIPEHMVLVNGGTFTMGDVMGDKERDNEAVYRVVLKDFLLAKYQLTFDEYDLFCVITDRNLPNDEGWGRGKLPVINISWFDAIQYCNWRSENENLTLVYNFHQGHVIPNWNANGYRLPTEAEWEYAAREGGNMIRFGNGKNIADPQEINFDCTANGRKPYSLEGDPLGKTLPVGSLNKPNALGLHEMSGNVWEWCWDKFGSYPIISKNNPKGVNKGQYRIYRGGSWKEYPVFTRTVFRGRHFPLFKGSDVGMRLARQY